MRLSALFVSMMLALTPVVAWSEPGLDVAWRVKGEGGFSAPKVIRDADGMVSGIVACEGRAGVVCLDLDGTRLWTYPLSPPISAAPAVVDLDGHGSLEIVAADGAGNLVVLTADGKLLWQAAVPGPVYAASCPAASDLDGDGRREVLVGDSTGHISCYDTKGKLRWRFQGDGTAMGPALIADIYELPGYEVVVTSHDGHIYALSAQGEPLWDIYRANDVFPNTNPILADTDGDGAPELYIGGGLHHFYRVDLAQATVQFEENVFQHINGSMAATDLDGDGREEVVFGTKGGAVRLYGNDGIRWTHALGNSTFYAGPVLLDLNGDSALEILMPSLNGDVQIIDNAGQTLWTLQSDSRPQMTPLAGDFDGDGMAEMVVGANEAIQGSGDLAFVHLGVPYRDDPRNRTTFAGDAANTGQAETAPHYRLVPAPAWTNGKGRATAMPHGVNALLSGPNTWRYNVANPTGERMALRLEIRRQDGAVERFVRHVRGASERVAIDFVVEQAGRFEMRQSLVFSDSRTEIAVSEQALEFAGFPDDERYLRETLGAADAAVATWRETQPEGAKRLSLALAAQRGLLGEASRAEGSEQVALTAALRTSVERLRALAVAAQSLAPAEDFIAWRYNPWAFFAPTQTLPAPDDQSEGMEVSLCRGEYASVALNLTNVSGKTLDIRVACGPLEGSSAVPWKDHVTFRRALIVPALDRDYAADALVRLEDGVLAGVAAYETQQVWITIHAGDLAAGEYTGVVRLKSIGAKPSTVSLPLRLVVHDLALPRPRPLRFNVWVHDEGELGFARETVLQDLVEHGVTVFLAPSPTAVCDAEGALTGPLDFSHHDAVIHRVPPDSFLLFLSPQSALTGQPFLSEGWRKAFVAYLRAWSAHMAELGVAYERWALYPYDEPSTPYGETMLNLVEVAKLAREAGPRILIYTDPTSGTTMESVRMLTGLVDIWQPSAELLERLPEIVPEARRVGKEVWFYDASGNAKTLSNLGLYRWRFWYAWDLGLRGVGWWVYASHPTDRWDTSPAGDYYTNVYDGPEGPIASKRWEASREGIQDYEYLWMLREAIHDAEGRGVAAGELDEARELLSSLPGQVRAVLANVGRRMALTPDGAPRYEEATRTLEDARGKIVAACLALKGQQ